MAHRIRHQGIHAFSEFAPAVIRQSRRMAARLGALTLLVALFLCTLIYLDYQRTIDAGQQRLSHVASLFNQTFLSSLDLATAQMSDLIGQLSTRDLRDIEAFEEEYGTRLQRIATLSEQIGIIIVVNPEGKVIWSTAPAVIGIDVSDRAYFEGAINLGPGGYTLGEPIMARGTGGLVTPVAWPITAVGQPVRGVIASSLDEEYFEALLTNTRFDPEMVIDIVSSNGSTAFSSAPRTADPSGAMLESRSRIRGSDLSTSVSIPQSEALQGLAIRSASFVAISAFLYACAIAAAFVAERRSRALAAALEQSKVEGLRAVQARNQFQAIFQNVDDGIVVFDDRGLIANANRQARDLLDVPDTQSAVALLKRYRPVAAGTYSEESTKAHSVVRLGTMKNGQQREIRCRISRVEHVLGEAYYCLLTDVSAEERLLNARVRFIESINHELRTPLTSLNGSLDLYMSRFGETLTPNGRKLIGMAKRNADRLLMLVNDVLTLQAVDHDRLVVTIQPLSTCRVVSEAIATMAGYAESFGVQICAADTIAEAWVLADDRRLQQVLGNLISNAVKYSPRGGLVVVGATLRENGSVALWCRDEGPGIPAHARSSIFERFATPAHDPSVQVTGSGLGLAISKELVSRQGGRLELETIHVNEPGGEAAHGSIFSVILNIDHAQKA